MYDVHGAQVGLPCRVGILYPVSVAVFHPPYSPYGLSIYLLLPIGRLYLECGFFYLSFYEPRGCQQGALRSSELTAALAQPAAAIAVSAAALT